MGVFLSSGFLVCAKVFLFEDWDRVLWPHRRGGLRGIRGVLAGGKRDRDGRNLKAVFLRFGGGFGIDTGELLLEFGCGCLGPYRPPRGRYARSCAWAGLVASGPDATSDRGRGRGDARRDLARLDADRYR